MKNTLKKLRRSVMSKLPFMQLESDVVDVLYLSWVVPSELALHHIPDNVTVQTREGKTLFTVLTYRHGHFGPSFLGKARCVFPSPLQSNWRFYVDRINGATPDKPTVLFARNVFSSIAYTVVTRSFSDALPSIFAKPFSLIKDDDSICISIKTDSLFSVTAKESSESLPSDFSDFYPDWHEAVRSLCLQDAAIARVGDIDGLALAFIDLPVDASTVIPMESLDYSPDLFLENLGATGKPFCFCLPKVKFKVLSERLIRN